MANPWEPFTREIQAYEEIARFLLSPKEWVKAAMRAANDKANGSYPVAHACMLRSINGGGAVTYGPSSKMSQAVLKSAELKALVKKKGDGTLKKQSIKFRSDANLSRSIHDGAISGEIKLDGKTFTFKGQITDTYDFRFGLPKSWTFRGIVLRASGNIAWVCTKLGLMKPYKITCTVDGAGKI